MTKMFNNFDSSEPMPRGPALQKALEEIYEAVDDPEKAAELHRRIMQPSPDDEGLAGIILVVMVALDANRTGPKDMAIKKLVDWAGLGGPEVCNKLRLEMSFEPLPEV
jgi:hypothetical protein